MPNYDNNTVREVAVARVPGAFVRVAVTSAMTVREALKAGGITVAKGELVRANGENVSLDANVNGFSTLTVSANIKGNR